MGPGAGRCRLRPSTAERRARATRWAACLAAASRPDAVGGHDDPARTRVDRSVALGCRSAAARVAGQPAAASLRPRDADDHGDPRHRDELRRLRCRWRTLGCDHRDRSASRAADTPHDDAGHRHARAAMGDDARLGDPTGLAAEWLELVALAAAGPTRSLSAGRSGSTDPRRLAQGSRRATRAVLASERIVSRRLAAGPEQVHLAVDRARRPTPRRDAADRRSI